MATIDDIAAEFAARIRTALRRDGFTKTASVNEAAVRYSSIASELKAIEDELAQLTQDDEPITEALKDRIVERTGERLGLSQPRRLRIVTKEASADNYVAMVSYISNLKKEIQDAGQ